MSLLGILGIVRDGLNAQSAGLAVSGQNVANASTEGYVRRTAVVETRPSGDGSQGGVAVQSPARSFDKFTWSRMIAEQGRQGAASSRSDLLARVEGIVAPPGGGIAERLNALFSAFQALSGYPGDLTARTNVLAKADSLAKAVSGAASDLETTQAELLASAQTLATDVNDRLSKVATLNAQIVQARNQGDVALDLHDQRDRLIGELSQRVGARSIEDDKGNATVFMGGTVLVEGSSANPLSVTLDSSSNLKIQATRANGSTVDITSSVVDGQLGGIRQVRDSDVVAAKTKLDTFAYDLAGAVNTVHGSGYGLDGVSGRALFAPLASSTGAAYQLSVDSSMVGHPERVAASASANDVPGGSGIAVSLAGLANASLSSGKSPSATFSAIAGDVGTARASADSELKLREDMLSTARAIHDSKSGVSVDEEMVNITKFQRAFEASTKVLKTVDELLQTLMRIV